MLLMGPASNGPCRRLACLDDYAQKLVGNRNLAVSAWFAPFAIPEVVAFACQVVRQRTTGVLNSWLGGSGFGGRGGRVHACTRPNAHN